MDKIGFGGGCHWCTEAVFQSLKAVTRVEQGFVSSYPPNDIFSEAVVIFFDLTTLPLEVLIDVHLRTHASTSNHTMRGKYRSAIYTFSDAQASHCREILERLQTEFDETLVTQVLPHREFKSSDERFHNYYTNDPRRPFCKAYIDPKLKILRDEFGNQLAN